MRALEAVERWAACPCAEHCAAIPGRAVHDPRPLSTVSVDFVVRCVHEAILREPDRFPFGEPFWSDLIAPRVRAWCLGRELPGVEQLVAGARAAREGHQLRRFAAAFDRTLEVLTLGDLPSRWDPDLRWVVPVMVPADRMGPTALQRMCHHPGKVTRIAAPEFVHSRLPTWATEGRRIVPLAPPGRLWAEVDALEVQRSILKCVSAATRQELEPEEHRARKEKGKRKR